MWDIAELEEEIQKLKKELNREISTQEMLALASPFFYFYNEIIYGIEIFPFTLPF